MNPEITAAEHIRNMTESDGWKIVKAKLDERILAMQNISNLDLTQPLEIQVKGYALAAREIYEWLREDVYGVIEQQQPNTDQKTTTETFIERG